MSFPESAGFPTSIWDGGSSDRSAAIDKEPINQIFRGPSESDWSKIVAETIAVETALQTVRTLVGAGNTGVVANAATSGFHYLPTVAGTPSGVPAATPAGFVPMIYDTTAHKIWVYDGGAWKATAALA